MDDLDALFAEAKSGAMQPSQGLLARVISDAEALQPKLGALTTAAAPSRPGFFSSLAALFGGAGALAGIGSAAVAGLVIGFVQPTALGSMSNLLASSATLATIDQVELIPDVSVLLAGE